MGEFRQFKGITLVEIAIVSAILTVLTLVVLIVIKPHELYKKSRDTVRVKELSQLYEAIHEYKLKNGVYPGEEGIVYRSDSPISSDPRSADHGWIAADLSKFTQIQFIDPTNNSTYHYVYTHSDSDFELNATLETKLDTMKSDKGDNDSMFEIGTLLDLLH